MRAYQCDRCGKLYPFQPDVNFIEYNSEKLGIRRASFINETSHPIVPDLCSTCFSSFIQWWNEGRN